MYRVYPKFRWIVPACLALLFLATSAYADTGVVVGDSSSWWGWLIRVASA